MMVADFKCIVQLNDNEAELLAYKQRRPHGLKQRGKVKHKVELIDQYRLILTTEAKLLGNRTKSISRHFRFDHIDYASKNAIKHKVFKLIDDALTRKEPSCLVRFSTLRECPMGLMTHLLVTKVEKRVRDLNMHILAISIEQYNIEKYNAESLLTVTYDNMPRIYFPTTLALLNWLQGDYYRLWQAGGGHECMDFEFHLADLVNSRRVVKFSFLQFYFEIMDRDTYDSLNSYFLNMGTKKKTKNSMITSCLKNYFSAPVPWTVWLLFDVLVENNGTCHAEDLLDFANVVATTLAVCKVDPKQNELKKKKKIELVELEKQTASKSVQFNSDDSMRLTSSITVIKDNNSTFSDRESLLLIPRSEDTQSNDAINAISNIESKQLISNATSLPQSFG
ncbi:uncharacterized protein LOC119662145 isoform X2 [Teleopsis dalmanni]|uniref:uncharacterized protein LOC119662145 isoform X2 n=1 Tax=Teleopsis dalmanni TaxID=139649 RepID=UPI0018CCFDA2|nr:uncharacterized protein LOC119662145 isoform X2 [Teleopsis dalmanni]